MPLLDGSALELLHAISQFYACDCEHQAKAQAVPRTLDLNISHRMCSSRRRRIVTRVFTSAAAARRTSQSL